MKYIQISIGMTLLSHRAITPATVATAAAGGANRVTDSKTVCTCVFLYSLLNFENKPARSRGQPQ